MRGALRRTLRRTLREGGPPLSSPHLSVPSHGPRPMVRPPVNGARVTYDPQPPRDHDHGHEQDHDHDHGPGCDHDHGGFGAHVHAPPGMKPRTALLVSLGLVGTYLVVQVVVGALTGSLAILSDAAHSFSDVAALLVALAAASLALRAAAPGTWGWGRAEVLGAFLNGVGLLVAVGFIVHEAVERLSEGVPEVPPLPVFAVGGLGLTINLIGAWFLWRAGKGNLNLRAALLHMLADALGSVGAMVAAGFLWIGFPVADVVVSLFIASLVLVGAARVLWDAGRILLELPPRGLDVAGLRAVVQNDPGIGTIEELRIWSLDGRTPVVAARVIAIEPVEVVRQRLRDRLARLGVDRAVIEVAPGRQDAT